MIKNISKFFFILTFALTFGFLASVVSAESPEIFAQPKVGQCESCHGVVHEAWDTGAHGEAGIACETCHSPIQEDHPFEAMPTNISSRLCGTCHVDTDAEFESSVHGSEDLTCIRCHNSHSTDIKTEGVQDLCQTCHQDASHFFSLSKHAENNVLCTDCHLPMATSEDRIGPGDRLHTFAVNLESCQDCHGTELHNQEDPACSPDMIEEAESKGFEIPCDEDEIVAQGLMLPDSQILSLEPGATNPLGIAIIAALVGMATGMILSPWLEKWFERFQR